MSKPSKLAEKGTRLPDIRQAAWDKTFSAYLKWMENPSHSESARSHRFAMLYQELFGDEPGFIEDYSSGIEKSIQVRKKDFLFRGRADNLFGNVIIEFKKDLNKQQGEAEAELRRYVAILWSEEPPESRTPYICLATDGVRLLAYTPKVATALPSPENITLQDLKKSDWSKLKAAPEEMYFYLDRYLRRQDMRRQG